jgi:hypothetical protein
MLCGYGTAFSGRDARPAVAGNLCHHAVFADDAARAFLPPDPEMIQVSRLEENAVAADLVLSPDHLARLAAIRPPAGDRYADMSPLNG